MSHNIAIILGTRREGAQSGRVAQFLNNYLSEQSEQLSINTTLVDPRTSEFAIENDHQVSESYKNTIDAADAFILVYPEYNHTYPGTLKSLLDGGYSEYTLKPFLLVGVSSGQFGGVRATEHLLPVLKVFGAYPLQNDLYITKVKETLNEDGDITDEGTLEALDAQLEQLLTLSDKFKQIRD